MKPLPPADPPPPGRLRVLIIEDSEDDALLLLQALRDAGRDPISQRVETAEAMRAALAAGEWDLILSDYTLPHFDAPRALAILRESGRATPIIVVSGKVGEDVAVETLKLGADDYLLKQNLTRLIPAIDRALQTAGERRQYERVEHMKTLIMANSLDLICTLDADGRFVEASAAAASILGYGPGELLGRELWDFLHPEDQPAARAEIAAIKLGRQTRDFENRYVRKDGGIVDMMWSAVWSPAEGVMVAVGRDVTGRKLAQSVLRLTLERLQLALKAGKLGTFEVDRLTRKVRWDEQMVLLYGEDAAAIDANGPERWREALHPGDAPRLDALRDEALNGPPGSFETEFRIFRRSDGAERTVRAMCSIIRDPEGRPARFIGINWDVTEERQRERALAAAVLYEQELAREARAGERAKSEFLAVMSHEIRTPMNGLLGFAGILAQTPTLPDDCRSHADIIVQSGEALLRILDDILDFSRLEAGRLEIVRTEFSPREMFDDIRTLLSQTASGKGLLTHIVMAAEVPAILRGDVGRLRQILLNLAGNAIKFTDHGSVTMGLRVAEEPPPAGGATFFEFFVRDTGTGIAANQLERIFQPFTQADSSISGRFGGTGLGLTISRRLAGLLGGHLRARSQPGEGSEFLMTVPLEVSDPGTNLAPPESPALDATFAGRHPMRVLLIEDDRVNLKLVLTLIRRLGYEPIAARNGREAVETYQREKPECLLMDLQMPEMDGIEATEKIRALERASGHGHRAFIAALTANIFPADRQRCFEAGMDGYLNKPVKLADLAAMLERARPFSDGQ